MGSGAIPLDDNKKPILAGYDPSGHQVVAIETVNVATDATTGILYGMLGMSPPANQSVNLAQVGGVSTQMATADGVTLANVQEIAIGLYNGTTLDRLKTAGALGDGFTSGLIGAGQFLFNGGSYDRLRTPGSFLTIAAVSITAGSPQAVWTPAGGRKFHLMGYCVTSTVSASLIFKDGTTEIFRVPVLAGAPVTNPGNFGNGYPGTVSNQALNLDVTTTGVVSGYVFGTSEF